MSLAGVEGSHHVPSMLPKKTKLQIFSHYLSFLSTTVMCHYCHITTFATELLESSAFLRRKLRRSPKKATVGLLYRTLVRPVLEYRSIVCLPHNTKH